jgi:hypothetical protein
MSPNREQLTWDKTVAITGIIGLIIGSVLSGFSVYQISQNQSESARLQEQANNLTQLSLELQNMTSNFQPAFIPYSIVASVRDVYSNSTLDAFGQLFDYGSLNVSLVVITPHASIINFTDTAFNITVRASTGGDDFLNSTNFFGSYAFLAPYLPYGFLGNQYSSYWTEAFIQSGFTQVNFAIPIFARIALNSNFTDHVFGGNLGSVNAEVTMFDVQTEKYVASYNFSTTLFVNVNWTYG